MNDETLDKVGQLAERLDNALFGYQNMKDALPSAIHLEGLTGTMFGVRNELAAIYTSNGGDEDFDFAAQDQT